MKTALLLIPLALLTSCSTGPSWSAQQRRALQMRTFDASYESVFMAAKNVLQDDGYLIADQDYKGGLILAKKSVDNKVASFMKIPILFESEEGVRGKEYQISFNIEKISKRNIETRLTIMESLKMNRGQGAGVEVVDPDTYKAIYDKLNTEIKRRAAGGRD